MNVKLTHALAELFHINVFLSGVQNIIRIMEAMIKNNVELTTKIVRFNLILDMAKKLAQNVMKLYVLMNLAVSYFSKYVYLPSNAVPAKTGHARYSQPRVGNECKQGLATDAIWY